MSARPGLSGGYRVSGIPTGISSRSPTASFRDLGPRSFLLISLRQAPGKEHSARAV
jgi:hypothetical protein